MIMLLRTEKANRFKSTFAVIVESVSGSLLSVSIRKITMTAYTLALKILTLIVVNRR